MNKDLLKDFKHYQAKERALFKARQDRDSSRLQLTKDIHALMRANGLNRRDVFKRLKLMTYVQIGNVLHLSQGLPSEAEWIELIKAVSEPKNKNETP
jgi:hypothetical protein